MIVVIDKRLAAEYDIPNTLNIKKYELNNHVIFVDQKYTTTIENILSEASLEQGFCLNIKNNKIVFSTNYLAQSPWFYGQFNEGIVVTNGLKYLKFFKNIKISIINESEFLNQENRRQDFCIFSNFKKLIPNTSIEIDDSTKELTLKTQLNYSISDNPASLEDNIVVLNKLLKSIEFDKNGIGIPLSGGIDSCTIAAFAKFQNDNIFTYTVGTSEGDEYEQARLASNFLATQHKEININNDQFLEAFHQCIIANEFIDVVYAEGFVGFYHIYLQAQKDGIKNLYTGYGADLVLGDIFNLQDRSKVNIVAFNALQRTAWTGEMHTNLESSFGINVHHPFLAYNMINFCISIPYTQKYLGDEVKYLLRKMAQQFQILPLETIWRKKNAFTTGASFHKVLGNILGCDALDYDYKNKYLYQYLVKVLS
jgi:asparagine synthetase B (glutamine-hydrolysing)